MSEKKSSQKFAGSLGTFDYIDQQHRNNSDVISF